MKPAPLGKCRADIGQNFTNTLRCNRSFRIECFIVTRPNHGGLAEWSIAAVLKTVGRESVPRVRIPEPPPVTRFRSFL